MPVLTGTGAMHAWTRQVADFRIGIRLAVTQFKQPHPGDALKFVGLIFLERDVVFGHARRHAGAATGTLVQVNDHPILFVAKMFVFHQNLIK
jgi:hypothetical protein